MALDASPLEKDKGMSNKLKDAQFALLPQEVI
jgi:hypothetical protein